MAKDFNIAFNEFFVFQVIYFNNKTILQENLPGINKFNFTKQLPDPVKLVSSIRYINMTSSFYEESEFFIDLSKSS